MEKRYLGQIVTGSLRDGLVMRLSSEYPLEWIKTGKFVSISGELYSFFSMIMDIELHSADPDILLFPPTQENSLLKNIIKKQGVYAHVTLRPMIMLDHNYNISPVKTIPAHFSSVFETSADEVSAIFGSEQRHNRYFCVGQPLDMATPVCINLEALSERSNGIFGRSGTGKTFITRLILAGLIKHQKAVNLIFDMHNEYGHQARQEGGGSFFVKGLKTLFPNKVAIFSLDPEATRRRGSSADVDVILSYQDIKVEDILALQDELNLHATAVEAAYLIAHKFKNNWLTTLLQQESSLKEFAESIGAHAESIGALYRKLKRLERFPFLTNQTLSSSVINRLLEYLDRGIHVIFEFGTHTSMLSYLLIANIITRRIHDAYILKTERYLASQHLAHEPQKLMITIEEAHKFLNPTTAQQTIFGIIAREMRKYYVTLLVVDQRPSSIHDEILSQIGTKIIAALSDEKDINSVLTGVHNSSGLKTILSTLDSKEQALVVGHAVTMPVVIKTRSYDERFYQDMLEPPINTPSIIQELY